jgi:hypothetical protein
VATVAQASAIEEKVMTTHCRTLFSIAVVVVLIVTTPHAPDRATAKPRIAVFSGPNATIQNNKSLVTSTKARDQPRLPLRQDASGQPLITESAIEAR